MTDTLTADWSVLEIEGVQKAAERAAKKIASAWAPSFELEDVVQDALILCATQADAVRTALEEGGIGRVHHMLWCDLQNEAVKRNRRQHLNTSYDAIVDGLTE